MNDQISSVYEMRVAIPNNWKFVETICKSALTYLGYFVSNRQKLDTAKMVIIELIENVIKYSDWESKQIPSFNFVIEATQKWIKFTSLNKVNLQTEHNHKGVQQILSMIKDSSSTMDTYAQRLDKIAFEPDGYSRLGLLRIAAEGQCKLDAELNSEGILQISALMSLKGYLMDPEKFLEQHV